MKPTAYMICFSNLIQKKKCRKENKGLRHACIKRNNQDIYIENKYNRKM